MEIVPEELGGRVTYPKGVSFDSKTLWNFKVRKFNRLLINKLPNEFRHMLKGYNHRNSSMFHIDTNNYNHF